MKIIVHRNQESYNVIKHLFLNVEIEYMWTPQRWGKIFREKYHCSLKLNSAYGIEYAVFDSEEEYTRFMFTYS
ncbi:Uncharacterised protein [uncultured archaeon]|nr:Uncharacterised protein [uncultured archaeon]